MRKTLLWFALAAIILWPGCSKVTENIEASAHAARPVALVDASQAEPGCWYRHYATAGAGECGMMIRDIGAFRNSALSTDFLRSFESKLRAARADSLIVRFMYGTTGGEDAELSRILGHIEQLAPILTEYADRIFVLQAGFIGAWGEWHGSQHIDIEQDGAQVADALIRATGADTLIAFRTPKIREALFPSWDGGPSEAKQRTGVHNDCILASDSGADAGTYDLPRAHWRGYANGPRFGGETCRVSAMTSCEVALPELKRLKPVYLNAEYNTAVIDQWKAEGCYWEIDRGLREGW